MIMTFWELVILLLVAGIIGTIGQSLAGYSSGGCVMSVALGFIGAILGRWLSAHLQLPDFFTLFVAGQSIPIVWSVIGATIFVVVINLLTRRIR